MSPKNSLRGLLRLGPVTVDIARMSVVGAGEEGRLTPKMLAVLLRLAERPGEIVTRADLIASAWPDSHPTDDALSFAVRELRRALGDDARAPRIIGTVHGVGYRIMVDGVVREEEPLEPVAPAEATPALAPESNGEPRRRPAWAKGVAAVAIGGLIALAALRLSGPAAVDATADAPKPASPPVFVTSDAGAEEAPALSPDGVHVAYSERASPMALGDIRIKRVVGPDARAFALTATPEVSEVWPSWSPDGRWIAFQAHSFSERAVMIAPADGGEPRRVAGMGLGVAGRMEWSADARQLLLSLPEDAPGQAPRLHLIDVQDGAIRRLRHDLDGSGWDLDPAYSPDGQWIAFRRGLPPYFDIFVIPAAGGAARQLTHLGDVRRGLSWTADGKEVVFSIDKGGRFTLLTVGLADGHVRPTGIVDASVPHVARRTPRLAFQRPIMQMGMARIDHRGGRVLSPVATSTGSLNVFHVSPQRDRVVYLSDRGGREQVWVHDAGRQTDRAYDVGDRISSLRWTDDGRAVLVVVRKNGLDHGMRLDLDTGRATALGLGRPLLRQLVDGGSPDRLFGLVQHGGQLQVARFDRAPDGWRESTSGVMAHRLVRVAGTPGVYARTFLDRARILRVDEDLTTHDIEIPPPIGVWTADDEAIWYTSSTGGVQELRRHPLDGSGAATTWPLPPGLQLANIGIGFLGDDLLLGTVTADKADIGVVMEFR